MNRQSTTQDPMNEDRKAIRSKKAELRRCNTELRSGENRHPETAEEEIQRLRKDLSACLAAKMGVEITLASLKEEKKYIKGEFLRNSRALQDMQEHLKEVQAQNEMLLSKVNLCVAEHKEKNPQGENRDKSLHERNKALSEQLLKVLEGYRNVKRKMMDVKEEQAEMVKRMGEAEYRISLVLSRMKKNGCKFVEDILAIEEILDALRCDARSPKGRI